MEEVVHKPARTAFPANVEPKVGSASAAATTLVVNLQHEQQAETIAMSNAHMTLSVPGKLSSKAPMQADTHAHKRKSRSKAAGACMQASRCREGGSHTLAVTKKRLESCRTSMN